MLNLKISEPDLGQFLGCLVSNCRIKINYYNCFVYGDEGNFNYPSKQYPKILTYFITNIREDSLFVYTQDSDNIKPNILREKWCSITEKTLLNKDNFQILPHFTKISNSNFSIRNKSNNLIDIRMYLVPKSLEFQIANVNMIKYKLSISNSIQNEEHKFLSEVLKRTDIEKRTLVESSVDLLTNKPWLKKILILLRQFFNVND